MADEETLLPLDIRDYDYIGTEGGLSVYAHGETARDYMKYKQSADIAGTPPQGKYSRRRIYCPTDERRSTN